MSSARVQTDPRITRRRQAVARSKRKRTLVGTGIVVALGAVVWAMFWSPLLHVRSFKVLGAERTEQTAVIDALGLAGQRRNLLLISTGELTARIEELPWVARATVERVLPGTVKVRVAEREPAFILAIDSARWTIDSDGTVLTVGKAERKLPVLTGVEVGHVEPGDVLKTPEATDALEAYSALPRAMRKRVVSIFAPTSELISFRMTEGPEIRYGAARQMSAKATVLKALLKRLKKEGRTPSYVDVRVPTSPAIAGDGHALEAAFGAN